MNRRRATVLISSAGRRVELLRSFREALAELGLTGRVLAADASPLSAAAHVADERFLVPPCLDVDFVPAMLDLCRRKDVDLVVPTIDTELPTYAEHRAEFKAVGTTVAVSSPDTIAIGFDKELSHRWLVENGFPTVRQTTVAEARQNPNEWSGPLIVKPRFGSASIGVRRVPGIRALAEGTEAGEAELVVQTLADGIEHTVDLLVTAGGTVVEAVPRRRLEVRAGEVSKGVTVRHPALEQLARSLAGSLPGAFGALNVQVFVEGDSLCVIELNPRFGGGFPLAYQAGANFPGWLLEDVLGLRPAPREAWRDGVVMLRYDAAVFVDAGEVGL